MASKLISDHKTITLLRLIIEEIGGAKNWSEKGQWQNIADKLWDADDREGTRATPNAVRLCYGAIMKKGGTSKSDDGAQVILFLRLVLEELGGPVKWSAQEQWSRIANKFWEAEGKVGKVPTPNAVRLRYGTLMKKTRPVIPKRYAATKPPAHGLLELMKAEAKKKRQIPAGFPHIYQAGAYEPVDEAEQILEVVTPDAVRVGRERSESELDMEIEMEAYAQQRFGKGGKSTSGLFHDTVGYSSGTQIKMDGAGEQGSGMGGNNGKSFGVPDGRLEGVGADGKDNIVVHQGTRMGNNIGHIVAIHADYDEFDYDEFLELDQSWYI